MLHGSVEGCIYTGGFIITPPCVLWTGLAGKSRGDHEFKLGEMGSKGLAITTDMMELLGALYTLEASKRVSVSLRRRCTDKIVDLATTFVILILRHVVIPILPCLRIVHFCLAIPTSLMSRVYSRTMYSNCRILKSRPLHYFFCLRFAILGGRCAVVM